MRKYFLAALFLFLILVHSAPGVSRVRLDKANLAQYAPGEILVKFKKTASKSDIVQLNTTLGSKTIKEFPSVGVRHIKLKPGETVSEAIKKYSSEPNVEYAEPNYILYPSQLIPTDPSFVELWGLNNTGQVVNGTAGTPDADIDAPEAWEITTGSANIVIAVIDTGVNYAHTDLVANMWTNTAEIPGNGIDDDGNGYIDDWRGWDFLGHEVHDPPGRAPDNDPMDQSDHGTHVAGTIAAEGNTLSPPDDIVGVMWTARIMPLRFLDGQGGWTTDAIDAINYAARMGAHIINASWGGYGYSQALYDAIANSGVLFVAAAGNEANDNDGASKLYPASYDLPNIISVAATDQIDVLADFSNYGLTSVDVGAPGTNIYSGILARNPVFSDDMEAGDANWAHDATDPTKDTWAITDTGPPSPPSPWGPPYSNSPTHSFTDSPYWPPPNEKFNYEPDTDSWLGLFSAIDLVGQFGTKLTFYVRYDLSPGDFLYIEGSSQHGPWYNYGGLTGSTLGTFREIDIDLSAHDNLPDCLVRFHLVTLGAEDGVYIDDVDIATRVPGDAYDHFQGTSMAAPHVSGLAGLIMAAFPGISNSAVKSRILNGVDPKPGLVGMTVSGGRINAMRSLSIPIAPSGLSARGVSGSQVNLSWTDNSTNEDEFFVYRKTDAGGAYTLVDRTVNPDVIFFTDGSVSPGQFYYYKVTAFNWWGESASTNESMTLTPGGNWGKTDGSPDSPCFIATAAYGSPDSNFIDLLRAFRDEYLMTHPIGKKWVALYYRYSPPMAGFIADHPKMRKGVRLILLPFVALSAGMVQTTTIQKGLIFCFIVGLLLGMALLSKGHKPEK